MMITPTMHCLRIPPRMQVGTIEVAMAFPVRMGERLGLMRHLVVMMARSDRPPVRVLQRHMSKIK